MFSGPWEISESISRVDNNSILDFYLPTPNLVTKLQEHVPAQNTSTIHHQLLRDRAVIQQVRVKSQDQTYWE